MLKKLLNECIIDMNIIPKGPLLVKGLDVEKKEPNPDHKIPDMKFILIRRNNQEKEEPYLPGGSLKGVMRSHAEKISRSLAGNSPGCCNPFWTYRDLGNDDELSCSDKLETIGKDLLTHEIYRYSCPICKIFGNSSLGSRFAISDAYLIPNEKAIKSKRDGVAIDRFTGGAKSGALYNYEVLETGTFTTQIRIRNFEIWQLGLISYVLNDMKDEMIRIGFGKRRGLGKVSGQVSNICFNYFGKSPDSLKGSDGLAKVSGIGNLVCDAERTRYDLKSDDLVDIEAELNQCGIRTTIKTNLENLCTATTGRWNSYIESYSLPLEMTGAEVGKMRKVVENG